MYFDADRHYSVRSEDNHYDLRTLWLRGQLLRGSNQVLTYLIHILEIQNLDIATNLGSILQLL
jgi:hypothetical protein